MFIAFFKLLYFWKFDRTCISGCRSSSLLPSKRISPNLSARFHYRDHANNYYLPLSRSSIFRLIRRCTGTVSSQNLIVCNHLGMFRSILHVISRFLRACFRYIISWSSVTSGTRLWPCFTRLKWTTFQRTAPKAIADESKESKRITS